MITYDRREIVTDADGQPVTRWDGRTHKTHPVTGEAVPDEAARTPLYAYVNARKAEWPAADYVVGNPPFIGKSRIREALGDGYAETLRQVYSDIPDSADFVMYWWDKAAELARHGAIKRFGLIATNSLRQIFNRRVLQRHLDAQSDKSSSLGLCFAIPDHPWVDSADGAAVRISMTVGAAGEAEGVLQRVVAEGVRSPTVREGYLDRAEIAGNVQNPNASLVTSERNAKVALSHGRATDTPADDSIVVELATQRGVIFADLTIGANVAAAQSLHANENLSSRGFELGSAGFIVTRQEAESLGLGRIANLEKHIREYRNGRDLAATSRDVLAIDLQGLDEAEVKRKYPEVYQWLLLRVQPERAQNRDKRLRQRWWLHRRSREDLREMLLGLRRFIATVETSKHRFFVFLDESITPDNMLVNIALDDAHVLGVLSSRIHITWALAAGGRLGVGNDPRYNKTRCFEPFPFPDCTAAQQARIRDLGEQLDAHRKRQQALHPELTLTEMYNVLEKERTGTPLTDKERATHERGLIAVLRQLHDELDAAVAEAYGWPANLPDEEILVRLVALNAERAREEQAGHIRWLRPDYQKPAGVQTALDTGETVTSAPVVTGKTAKLPWPKTLPEQAAALRAGLAAQTGVVSADELAKAFKGARAATVANLLQTLVSLGLAREVEAGKFAA